MEEKCLIIITISSSMGYNVFIQQANHFENREAFVTVINKILFWETIHTTIGVESVPMRTEKL